MNTSWLWRNRQEILIVLMLLVVAGLPRLLDLGVFLTADEKNWIGRSYEFIRAFKDFRFNDMLQTTHPGVTTMWAVGISVTAKMLIGHVPFSFNNLVHFATAAQLPIAIFTTFSIPLFYFLLRQLLGRSIAITTALLIALDPFLIGYSRVAHVDAMLAHFLFIAALGLLLYRQQYQQKWLLFSAVVAGLAILTKVPAIFLMPYFWLVVVTDRRMWSWSAVNARLKDFVIWGIIVGLMFVIIWPAMLWVPNPRGNVLVLKRDIGQAAITPHHMVEDYTVNPWHYPATLLTRTTPTTLVFGSVAIIWLISKFSIFPTSLKLRGAGNFQFSNAETKNSYNLSASTADPPTWRATYALLLVYVFFFIVMMTIGAKKGDRYILPVWPALDVLAASGIVMVGSWFSKLFAKLPPLLAGPRSWAGKIGAWKLLQHVLPLMVIMYLAIVVVRYHPYAIAYASPFFRDNVSQELGWGEGLEQVAAWLNNNAPDAVVASWYPEELGAYTSAHVAHINAHQQGKVQYVVLYRNMFGRAPDHYANNFIDEYYKKREPVFVAHVVGKEFAWVYDKWVFESIVGELLPHVRVTQEIAVAKHPIYGIDILPATYSSTINRGTLIVRLIDEKREIIHEWRTPVPKLSDNEWLTLALPAATPHTGKLTVEVFAEDTLPKNAPTIRIARKQSFRPGDVAGSVKHQGDLAVRLRYLIAGQQVTEEEGKLLQQLVREPNH